MVGKKTRWDQMCLRVTKPEGTIKTRGANMGRKREHLGKKKRNKGEILKNNHVKLGKVDNPGNPRALPKKEWRKTDGGRQKTKARRET